MCGLRVLGAEATTGEAGRARRGRAPQAPRTPPRPRRRRLGKETRDPHTPHCVDNRNHKIAITVSEAVNKRDTPGF